MLRTDGVRNYSTLPALKIFSDTNLYWTCLLTLNPNQRSSSLEVTFVIVPFGRTSSKPTTLSTVSPCWLVKNEKPKSIWNWALRRRKALTSTKRQPWNTDTGYTPSYKVQSKRFNYRIHLIPTEASPDINCSTLQVDICLIEARQRDLYACRRGKSRVRGVSWTFHGKGSSGWSQDT